jgi:hypothetical protein
LKTIAEVNKKFHEFSRDKLDELTNNYKSNIFYTAGRPHHFKIPPNTGIRIFA